MRWIIVSKQRVQPSSGTYSSWKLHIARDCNGQCVYCSISEGEYGGVDNFHVDHFRPKSKPEFKHLENDIHNLFLACAICNRFKSDDWPGDPHPQGIIPTFLDPSHFEYKAHINLNKNSLELAGSSAAGTYTVERLYLNRPQLLRMRRTLLIYSRLHKVEDFFEKNLDKLITLGGDGASLLADFSRISILISRYRTRLVDARPYVEAEIKRAKPAKKSGPSGARIAKKSKIK